MNYKKVKRFLALIKAQTLNPEREIIKDSDLPDGFKESFENQDSFRGWGNYHITWDVKQEDPWTAYVRTRSNIAEWHDILVKVVPVITPDGTIVSAEEWDSRQNNGVSEKNTKTIPLPKKKKKKKKTSKKK